jgi:hypothetical protein
VNKHSVVLFKVGSHFFNRCARPFPTVFLKFGKVKMGTSSGVKFISSTAVVASAIKRY